MHWTVRGNDNAVRAILRHAGVYTPQRFSGRVSAAARVAIDRLDRILEGG